MLWLLSKRSQAIKQAFASQSSLTDSYKYFFKLRFKNLDINNYLICLEKYVEFPDIIFGTRLIQAV
jgi:hypothetical protein